MAKYEFGIESGYLDIALFPPQDRDTKEHYVDYQVVTVGRLAMDLSGREAAVAHKAIDVDTEDYVDRELALVLTKAEKEAAHTELETTGRLTLPAYYYGHGNNTVNKHGKIDELVTPAFHVVSVGRNFALEHNRLHRLGEPEADQMPEDEALTGRMADEANSEATRGLEVFNPSLRSLLEALPRPQTKTDMSIIFAGGIGVQATVIKPS